MTLNIGLAVTYDFSTSLHVGEIGKGFVVTILDSTGSPVNLSIATALTFSFLTPSGKVLSVTPRLTTNGVDGSLTYTTVAGDLSEEGVWRLQATVTLASATLHSDITTFSVLPNLV